MLLPASIGVGGSNRTGGRQKPYAKDILIFPTCVPGPCLSSRLPSCWHGGGRCLRKKLRAPGVSIRRSREEKLFLAWNMAG